MLAGDPVRRTDPQKRKSPQRAGFCGALRGGARNDYLIWRSGGIRTHDPCLRSPKRAHHYETLFRVYSRYFPSLTRRDGTAFDNLIKANLKA
ncbi:hypothetical protein EGI94_01045 [Stutzerimonas stutzeri]|nr:hypothetical protein EGI94_01045 [Stutzerimonas stutzeri]